MYLFVRTGQCVCSRWGVCVFASVFWCTKRFRVYILMKSNTNKKGSTDLRIWQQSSISNAHPHTTTSQGSALEINTYIHSTLHDNEDGSGTVSWFGVLLGKVLKTVALNKRQCPSYSQQNTQKYQR